MKAKDLMNKEVISVKYNASIKEVALLLLKHEFSGVPVVDDKDNLVGVVSEKDIFKILYPNYSEVYVLGEEKAVVDISQRILEVGDKKVEEFMTKKPISVSPEDSVIKVGAVMLTKKIHRVLVVDDDKIVGILTREEIYPKSLEIFK